MTAKTTAPKRIVLHRPSVDNAGLYQDAGTELTIGDATGEAGERLITDERAKDLLDSFGAQVVSVEA